MTSLDHDFLCNCECGCKNKADAAGLLPTLCMECALMSSLNSPKHGLPYTPATIKPLDPEVPIADEQKNEAIQNFVAENGF